MPDATFTQKRRLIMFGLNRTVPCLWCLKTVTFAKATLEHVDPLSLGGTSAYDNLDISCKKCNNERFGIWLPRRTRLQRLVLASSTIAALRQELFGEVPYERWSRRQKRRRARHQGLLPQQQHQHLPKSGTPRARK
jgi:hypothetical protein